MATALSHTTWDGSNELDHTLSAETGSNRSDAKASCRTAYMKAPIAKNTSIGLCGDFAAWWIGNIANEANAKGSVGHGWMRKQQRMF
jgi:hypothetical protein